MAAQQTEAVTNLIQQQVLKAAEIIEERLDQEIKNLDELKSDDIEKLRERRLLQLKKEAKKRQEYLARVSITPELFIRHLLLLLHNFTGFFAGTRRLR